MENNKQQLLLQQTDKKFKGIQGFERNSSPKKSWINPFRTTLKSRYVNLDNRLHITPKKLKNEKLMAQLS